MTQTPGQRTASTVLDLIDGAIAGGTSPDAMRWTPERVDHDPTADPSVSFTMSNETNMFVPIAAQVEHAAFFRRWLATERIAAQVMDPGALPAQPMGRRRDPAARMA